MLPSRPPRLQLLSIQASIDEIEVRLAKLAKDCERYRNLVEKKAATPIQLEQLEVEYAATKKKLEW